MILMLNWCIEAHKDSKAQGAYIQITPNRLRIVLMRV